MPQQFADVHHPVLVTRVVELLRPALERPGAVYVDGTLGLGGHARAVLEAFPRVRVVGIDRDPDALAVARERLAPWIDRVDFAHAIYHELPDVLVNLGIGDVQGILLDLGLSSLQIDRAERGFAYSVDAPLDMRMNPSSGPTAADVVNGYSPVELKRILRVYGEEKFADGIVRGIVQARESEPFETSAQLVATIQRAVPSHVRRGHPAKRTFQALRIEVNRELDSLREALPAALGALAIGGRMAVLSYHSLEDRLVKQTFANGVAERAPAGLPVVPEHLQPELAHLTKGAELASDEEISTNPRAASVRLRAVERIRKLA